MLFVAMVTVCRSKAISIQKPGHVFPFGEICRAGRTAGNLEDLDGDIFSDAREVSRNPFTNSIVAKIF